MDRPSQPNAMFLGYFELTVKPQIFVVGLQPGLVSARSGLGPTSYQNIPVSDSNDVMSTNSHLTGKIGTTLTIAILK